MSPPPSTTTTTTTTRWCPTPEQLMILEELYRRGLKTPNSSQIQRITANLSLYGKIQGKNVFYWFQNHKARDRQKLRKKLIANQLLHHNHIANYQLHPPTHYPFPLIYPQGSEDEVMKVQTWSRGEDLPCACGHDSMMIIDAAGPTFPCCTRNPPQTLQLFPLSPPS